MKFMKVWNPKNLVTVSDLFSEHFLNLNIKKKELNGLATSKINKSNTFRNS